MKFEQRLIKMGDVVVYDKKQLGRVASCKMHGYILETGSFVNNARKIVRSGPYRDVKES